MEVRLQRAVVGDAEAILELQVRAFLPLLEKYEDADTNPANEGLEKLVSRITNSQGAFYKIMLGDILVGGIGVKWKDKENQLWLGPLFVHPLYQGQGIARKAMDFTEQMYPQAESWGLATVAEEERNCRLYEKMGYTRTAEQRRLNDKATLVFYQKVV